MPSANGGSFKDNWRIGTALLAALLGLGLLGAVIVYLYAPPAAGAHPPPPLCSDEPKINDQINNLAFEALDEAFRTQIETLFSSWMRDSTGQPDRAGNGARTAAVAYVHARTLILAWNMPRCTPEKK